MGVGVPCLSMLRETPLRRRLPGVSNESIRRSSSDWLPTLAVVDRDAGPLRETLSLLNHSSHRGILIRVQATVAFACAVNSAELKSDVAICTGVHPASKAATKVARPLGSAAR
jgi:hypothetical protein